MKLEFAKNIKSLRLKRGITQNDLAEQLGVSEQTVSRWESSIKASYPDIELLPTIAGFFGVTVDELLGCSKAQSDERLAKYWEEVNAYKDDGNKRMSILLRMYEEYPNNFDVMYNICWTGTYEVNNRFESENVALVRECAKRILEECTNKSYREDATRLWVNIEDEDKIDEVLDKYTTDQDLSRHELLTLRYCPQNKDDKAKYQKFIEMRLEDIILKLIYSLEPDVPLDYRKTNEYDKWFNTAIFKIINALSDSDGDFIIGDGEIDWWTIFRIRYGKGLALSYCIKHEFDKALDILDKVTTLEEKAFELPAGTILSSRCPALTSVYMKLEAPKPYICRDKSFGTTLKFISWTDTNNPEDSDMIFICPAWEYFNDKRYYEENHPEFAYSEGFKSIFERLARIIIKYDGKEFFDYIQTNFPKPIDKAYHI